MSTIVLVKSSIPRSWVGKRVSYGDNSGYLLLQGFEKHGENIFVYGLLRGGLNEGIRPENPRHPRKKYYQANFEGEQNSFNLVK